MHLHAFALRITVLSACLMVTITATAQMRQVGTEPWEGPDPHAFRNTTPEDVGFDAKALDAVAQLAREGESESLVIVRDGKIALERYWTGVTSNDVKQMYSATKSPFTFLIGRAIRKHYIKSIDQPIVELVPEIAGSGREALTFRNIMAMESGLEQSRSLDEADQKEQLSQFEAVMTRSVEREPYTWYHYNNAGYRLLFTALERASGKTIPELTREELFEPLGMQGAYWVEHRDGDELKGYQSIRMRPTDLAKIGQVMLNGGTWGGKRYLPPYFLKKLDVAPAPEVNPSYGLFWHLNSGDFYLTYYESDRVEGNLMPGTPPDAIANYGSRGQLIVVIPSLDIVWIRTGSDIPSTIWEKDSFVTRLSAAVVAAVR